MDTNTPDPIALARAKNTEKMRLYREKNREAQRAYLKAYREKNKDRINEQQRALRAANPEQYAGYEANRKDWNKERNAAYRAEHAPELERKRQERRAANLEAHRERDRGYAKKAQPKRTAYRREVYLQNTNNLLAQRLRDRLLKALKGNAKRGSAIRELGCAIAVARAWLEAKFYGGMTWENYGTLWEIDHVKALCLFDLQDTVQLAQACNYHNLQPLTIADHQAKTRADLLALDNLQKGGSAGT